MFWFKSSAFILLFIFFGNCRFWCLYLAWMVILLVVRVFSVIFIRFSSFCGCRTMRAMGRVFSIVRRCRSCCLRRSTFWICVFSWSWWFLVFRRSLVVELRSTGLSRWYGFFWLSAYSVFLCFCGLCSWLFLRCFFTFFIRFCWTVWKLVLFWGRLWRWCRVVRFFRISLIG